MTARRAIATVLLAGVGVGGATALLDRADGRRADAAPVAGVDRSAPHGIPLTPIATATIAARADDPGGATAWAVRRVTTRPRGRRHPPPCLQLGRLDAGRFGWIAPGRPFRLARFDLADVPVRCQDGFPRGLPQLSTVTLTTDATTGLPEPERTIVWGALPPGFVSARLSDGTPLRAGPRGVVLSVLPGRPVGQFEFAGTLRTAGGTTRRFAYPRFDRYQVVGRTGGGDAIRRRLREAGSPIARAIRIAARAPDPAGGAAWGIVTAPSTTGGVCFSTPGHLVGERLASVQPRLGIALPAPFGQQLDCSDRRAPSAAHPVRMDVLVSSVPNTDPGGTVQLRRLNDRTVVHGRVTADVTAVTITTSRDIRTVVPDASTHVVLAVYDGTFPGEHVKVTAKLRDGSTRTVMQTLGS